MNNKNKSIKSSYDLNSIADLREVKEFFGVSELDEEIEFLCGRAAPFRILNELCSRHRARVIVIGDVHGCLEELLDLLRKVEFMPGDLVLFLGDLVAKGPKSKAVIRSGQLL